MPTDAQQEEEAGTVAEEDTTSESGEPSIDPMRSQTQKSKKVLIVDV